MSRDGIRTLDDLRQRCVVTDAGCWLWKGALSHGKPAVWLPDHGCRSMPAALSIILTGKPLPKGQTYRAACGDPMCASPFPGHRHRSTVSRVMRELRPTLDAAHRAKIAAAKRAQCAKLSHAIAAEIRASSEPNVVLAERYGVHHSRISVIRAGRGWAPVANSVFALGAAANAQQRREAA